MPSLSKYTITIGAMAVLGLALVVGLVSLYASQCGQSWAEFTSPTADSGWFFATVCKPIHDNPPWALLSAVAAAPSLFLTWYLRWISKDDELRIAQEQQITARFASAVRMLGEQSIPARLGGIYSLQQVARDSDIDRAPVVETLCAFVRDRSPRVDQDDDPYGFSRPATDVQAALYVIGSIPVDGKRQINLSECDLTLADFRGLKLANATFARSWLCGADFRDAELTNADFSNAALAEADMSRAILRGVNLTGARLEKANVSDAVADGVDFGTAADTTGTDYAKALVGGKNLWQRFLEIKGQETDRSDQSE